MIVLMLSVQFNLKVPTKAATEKSKGDSSEKRPNTSHNKYGF
jgi:hypothetical protein